MITKILLNNYNIFDCRGLNAERNDAKEGCANGSTYYAIDTGDIYMLKATEDPVTHVVTTEWVLQ